MYAVAEKPFFTGKEFFKNFKLGVDTVPDNIVLSRLTYLSLRLFLRHRLRLHLQLRLSLRLGLRLSLRLLLRLGLGLRGSLRPGGGVVKSGQADFPHSPFAVVPTGEQLVAAGRAGDVSAPGRYLLYVDSVVGSALRAMDHHRHNRTPVSCHKGIEG